MVVFGAGGGGNSMSVSQQSNEGIGSDGPDDDGITGIVVLATLLVALFLFFFLFG
ncbi:hypothetical protein [Halorussus salinus]|uniref:hypothetical protein n=1 Tax=Halorussus salinus TaxID=1364935 RepID=UPI00138EF6A2|nr:hypothetical protein [Halorussus salinus]